jgi:hypothetical protein
VRKRFVGVIVFVVLVAAIVGGSYWLAQPDKVSAAMPKGAPAPGSCWKVDPAAAAAAFPWPGHAVDCGTAHTAEVFQVGQVNRELAAQARQGAGDEAKVAQRLMYGQARSACIGVADTYLGGRWRTARVQVVASWIKPQQTGHFGCAVIEVADPAGTRFVPRTGSLRGALGGDGLSIGCVAGTGADLAYAPCDQPHEGQYTGTYIITPPGAPFDGEKVRAAAESGCAEVARKYIGADRADLRIGYVGPTSSSDWLGSDQTFACYSLSTGAEKLRGSLKGLGSAPLPR